VDVISSTAPNASTPVTAPAPTPAPAPSTVTLSGRVAAVSGSCPALTFAVSDVTVTTNASTSVSGGTCAQIANGVQVEVTGTRQADRSIAASKIVIRAMAPR
jgi:hypothetical protein